MRWQGQQPAGRKTPSAANNGAALVWNFSLPLLPPWPALGSPCRRLLCRGDGAAEAEAATHSQHWRPAAAGVRVGWLAGLLWRLVGGLALAGPAACVPGQCVHFPWLYSWVCVDPARACCSSAALPASSSAASPRLPTPTKLTQPQCSLTRLSLSGSPSKLTLPQRPLTRLSLAFAFLAQPPAGQLHSQLPAALGPHSRHGPAGLGAGGSREPGGTGQLPRIPSARVQVWVAC